MKKGFTLVELLGVLVLVAALFTIVMSSISSQMKSQEAEIGEAEIKTYCAAAKLYVNKEDYSSMTEIKLTTLEQAGFLSNLTGKYRNKSIYVQYLGNYYCCCTTAQAKICNQDQCER